MDKSFELRVTLTHMDNSSGKKSMLTLFIVLALILVVGVVYFWGFRAPAQRLAPLNQDLSGAEPQAFPEDSQVIPPSPSPIVPQTNPFEEAKTNPFRDIKTNPFD